MKKKLITSALPYVNNSPHLGNLIGCVLSADVYARFCRLRGYETLYVCGTDEYGTATEKKARENGVSPKEICDRYFLIHKEIYDFFQISFDIFGRTSDPVHTEVVQTIFRDMDPSLLCEKTSEQLYCGMCATFLADRFIVGTCPACKSSSARGDQCDQCGKLLSGLEVVNPSCATCSSPPEIRETQHLYIRLESLQESLVEWQTKSIATGGWTENAGSFTASWMQGELHDRPITRDLQWGVPVPYKGFEKKVFYVWFDAPIGYISITKKALPNGWEKWWKNPEHTELYQFMAKDNILFHSVLFPATQLATKDNWTKLHHLNSTEYLNYEDKKFSKSSNRGVFGEDVMELGISVDLWRYYLLSIRPEKQDASFYWDDFRQRINGEFIDTVANLVNRVLSFLDKHFEGRVLDISSSDLVKGFLSEVREREEKITALLEKVALKEALQNIVALGARANQFFQEHEPWKKIKEDRVAAYEVVSTLVYTIRDLAILLAPYMPGATKKILAFFEQEEVKWEDLGRFAGLENIRVQKPEILYPKIEPEMISQLQVRFG
jgi:methionyl-tRNA synthetase